MPKPSMEVPCSAKLKGFELESHASGLSARTGAARLSEFDAHHISTCLHVIGLCPNDSRPVAF